MSTYVLYGLGLIVCWLVGRWLTRCWHPRRKWILQRRNEQGEIPLPGQLECWWDVCGECFAPIHRLQYTTSDRPKATGAYDETKASTGKQRADDHERRRRKLEAKRSQPRLPKPVRGPVLPIRKLKQ